MKAPEGMDLLMVATAAAMNNSILMSSFKIIVIVVRLQPLTTYLVDSRMV